MLARIVWLMLAFLMRTASAFVLAGGSVQTRRAIAAAATPPSMFYEEANGFVADALVRLERLERGMLHDTYYASLTDGLDVEERGALALQNHVRPSLNDGGLSVSDNEDAITVTFRTADAIEPSDVSVYLQEDQLIFSGFVEANAGGARFRSSFSRSITLPSDVDGDVLTTRYETGRVTVSLPKFTDAAKVDTKVSDAALAALSGEEIVEEAQSEAERLAAESPRVARWLRAHGYLGAGTPRGRFESLDGGRGEDFKAEC